MMLHKAIFLVFLLLKLAGVGVVATWSWWWITSPLWIVVSIAFVGGMFKGALKRLEAYVVARTL